jgi:hypothetical protein
MTPPLVAVRGDAFPVSHANPSTRAVDIDPWKIEDIATSRSR